MMNIGREFGLFFILVFLIVLEPVISAVPKPEEISNHRVIADKEHYVNGEHHTDYDHEAFLGEEAPTFDQLTPEESKKRLGSIVDKIDKNNDSEITHEELKDWIRYTQTRYLVNDVDKQWKTHNIAGKDNLIWDEYRKTVYGFSHDYEANVLDKEDAASGYSYKNMLDRDKRRWSTADIDGDDALTRDEFAAFLHPEEVIRMQDIVVLESMEDIDKNKDDKISVEEYLGDMYPDINNEEDIPEWVKSEKEYFHKYRDKDGDGFLNPEEVKQWILPQGFDPAEAEARHLIYEADANDDEKLTKEEILDKYDLFVGSQATDFGEALARHDEF